MSIRLMVVDDSKFVYNEMVFFLEDSEFELVKYCRSGEEAVDAYLEAKPDLVTMDIILPRMDGFECAKMILKEDPEAKIVFVSSLAYDDTIEEAKELGCDEFLFKPFERDSLIGILTRAANKARKTAPEDPNQENDPNDSNTGGGEV